MLVTILTVSYNSEKTIARTIESVLNQTYDDIEYIIIDGNSTDNTVAVAESYKEAFGKHPGRSLTIISEHDRGMYDALNKGAKLAHGELVGQVNADDWYEPDAVEIMAGLYNRTAYDAAWGSLRMTGKTTWIKHAYIGRLWTSSGWCHPAMFSRREVLLSHPYPLESMYDDFDYITALHVEGQKLETIDRVITNFSFGQGGMSTDKSFAAMKERIRIVNGIYRKYGMSRFYTVYRVLFEFVKMLATR